MADTERECIDGLPRTRAVRTLTDLRGLAPPVLVSLLDSALHQKTCTAADLQPVPALAAALALADVTTFSHYARRWWGVTAREFRASAR